MNESCLLILNALTFIKKAYHQPDLANVNVTENACDQIPSALKPIYWRAKIYQVDEGKMSPHQVNYL